MYKTKKSYLGIKKINHYFLENNVHKTAQMRYPVAKSIPLPRNVEGIITNEIGRFSPQRTRDLNGPVIVSQTSGKVMPLFQIERTKTCFDPRVASFDCMSAVNLNSSMQTNVPYPFSSKGKSTHLNMPGGQWESKNKFISEDMQKAHSYNMKKKKEGMRMFHTLTNNYDLSSSFFTRRASSDSKQSKKEIGEVKLTLRQKLQKAITEYGTTVIVFHVGISLVSLGTCYILVSRYVSRFCVVHVFININCCIESIYSVIKASANDLVIYAPKLYKVSGNDDSTRKINATRKDLL